MCVHQHLPGGLVVEARVGVAPLAVLVAPYHNETVKDREEHCANVSQTQVFSTLTRPPPARWRSP